MTQVYTDGVNGVVNPGSDQALEEKRSSIIEMSVQCARLLRFLQLKVDNGAVLSGHEERIYRNLCWWRNQDGIAQYILFWHSLPLLKPLMCTDVSSMQTGSGGFGSITQTYYPG